MKHFQNIQPIQMIISDINHFADITMSNQQDITIYQQFDELVEDQYLSELDLSDHSKYLRHYPDLTHV